MSFEKKIIPIHEAQNAKEIDEILADFERKRLEFPAGLVMFEGALQTAGINLQIILRRLNRKGLTSEIDEIEKLVATVPGGLERAAQDDDPLQQSKRLNEVLVRLKEIDNQSQG